MAAETAQDMVKAAVAAGRLGVSSRTVKRAIIAREIPGLRVGTVYVVNAAWLAEVTSWAPAREPAA